MGKEEEIVEKEKIVENGLEIDTSDLLNSSTSSSDKKKKKKDKNRETSPPPSTIPTTLSQSPKKSPIKSPVKEAKVETPKKPAPVNTPNKNVKKSLASGDAKPGASPAGKKKKDPNAPKLPKSAFSEFMEEYMVKKRAEGQKVNII